VKYLVRTADLRSFLVDDPGSLHVIVAVTEARAVELGWAEPLPAPVVCPLCVQWRCAVCKSNERPECCTPETHDFEPYWPDGTLAVLTQDEYCATCALAMEDYLAQSEHEVPA
jgi:hypothetical protein